jgi:hypothetical protein
MQELGLTRFWRARGFLGFSSRSQLRMQVRACHAGGVVESVRWFYILQRFLSTCLPAFPGDSSSRNFRAVTSRCLGCVAFR